MIRALGPDAPEAVFQFLDGEMSRRGREHWLWKYRSIDDDAPAAFYWQEDDGTVLGFVGLMRTGLQVATTRHSAAWFVDWYVRPGAKAVGVGVALLRKAEASAGMLLTLQGSIDTQKILPRLGWKQSFSPVTFVRPLSGHFLAAWLAQRVGGWVRRAGQPLGLLVVPRLRCAAPATPPDVALVDVDRFAPLHDRVWQQQARALGPAMRRDSDYLNHMCADYPGRGYRLQVLHDATGEVGHLVTRIDEDRKGLHRGRIVDLLWPASSPRLAAWLTACACVQLQRSGADYVECLASTLVLRGALESSRFRARRPVPIWYHRLAADVLPPDSWHITLLDCDRAYR